VALRDPATNLAHDLLDIDVFAVLARALLGGLRGSRPTPIVATPVRTTATAVKVLSAPVLRILICHRL
jgi:hypothetical protein